MCVSVIGSLCVSHGVCSVSFLPLPGLCFFFLKPGSDWELISVYFCIFVLPALINRSRNVDCVPWSVCCSVLTWALGTRRAHRSVCRGSVIKSSFKTNRKGKNAAEALPPAELTFLRSRCQETHKLRPSEVVAQNPWSAQEPESGPEFHDTSISVLKKWVITAAIVVMSNICRRWASHVIPALIRALAL